MNTTRKLLALSACLSLALISKGFSAPGILLPPIPQNTGPANSSNTPAIHFGESEYFLDPRSDTDQVELVIENPTSAEIEVTHLGSGTQTIALALSPTMKIAPKKTLTVNYTVYRSNLLSGTAITAIVGIKSNGTDALYSTSASVHLKGEPRLSTQVLSWNIGEADDEKELDVTFPEGTVQASLKAVHVLGTKGQFTARFEGNKIFVRPTSVSQIATAGLVLEFDPVVDQSLVLPIGLAVRPKAVASKDAPAPSNS